MNTAGIRLENVSKSFANKAGMLPVLRDITCTFAAQQSYAITGVSGTGKSTLLHLLAGLDQPTGGAIFLGKHNYAQLKPREHAALLNISLGLVFQQPYLIRELSVLENVALKGRIASMSQTEATEKAHVLLKRIGLADKATDKVSALSGGQQQRIAILRALFNQPDFLLADEPTGNLDEATGKDIIDFLYDCQQEWRMGMIISSHDAYVAKRMETCYHIENGTLVRK